MHKYFDVHAHLNKSIDFSTIGNGPFNEVWDTDAATAYLDRFNIQTQLLSMPFMLDGGRAGASVRVFNELLSQIVATNPNRFGAFAVTASNDIKIAQLEIAYALDVLKLDGLAITTNSNGRYLSDPYFKVIFQEATIRDVPVFVHPVEPVNTTNVADIPFWLVEFPVDTARAITDLIYSNVFDKFPDLKIIFSHCGGAFPSLAWRVTHLKAMVINQSPSGSIIETIQNKLLKLYFDTALSGAIAPINSVLSLTDIAHILYGTDSGAAPDYIIKANTDGLPSLDILEATKHRILTDNAKVLFSRFRA